MKQIISVLAIAGSAVLFASSCTTSADRQRDALLKDQAAQIETMKMEMARKHIIDSMNAVTLAAAKSEEKPAVQTVAVRKPATRTYTKKYVSGNASAYREPTYTQPTYTRPVVYNEPVTTQPEKKGWSAKAKGAVIGTAVGAGAGAVINKRNRAAGAAIGAVLGAGAGTGIGAVIDKKNGR